MHQSQTHSDVQSIYTLKAIHEMNMADGKLLFPGHCKYCNSLNGTIFTFYISLMKLAFIC